MVRTNEVSVVYGRDVVKRMSDAPLFYTMELSKKIGEREKMNQ